RAHGLKGCFSRCRRPALLNRCKFLCLPNNRWGCRGTPKRSGPRLLLGRGKFLILHNKEPVFTGFITARFVAVLDDLAGHSVHELLAEAISGLPVDLPKGNSLRGGD